MLDLSRFEYLSFDCYGTLIDWESGILGYVRPLLHSKDREVTDAEILNLYASNRDSGYYQFAGAVQPKINFNNAVSFDYEGDGDGDYEVGDPNGNDKQELQARCDVANAAGARLFISVHINSSFSSAPSGLTTYYWRQDDRPFAQDVQSATAVASGEGDAGVGDRPEDGPE